MKTIKSQTPPETGKEEDLEEGADQRMWREDK